MFITVWIWRQRKRFGSFSYKPALLSKGIIVAPEHFWHGYPDSEKWIVVNEEGEVNERLFDISLKLLEKGTE